MKNVEENSGTKRSHSNDSEVVTVTCQNCNESFKTPDPNSAFLCPLCYINPHRNIKHSSTCSCFNCYVKAAYGDKYDTINTYTFGASTGCTKKKSMSFKFIDPNDTYYDSDWGL